MIDKKIGEKHIYFELSVGNSGNAIDGHNETCHNLDESDAEDNLGNFIFTFFVLLGK